MSYQVIARKYRPQKFADVVGQEHVTQTLANAIAQNRLAHAYLFCGPRGTGKTTLARIFAKCLRCKNAPTPEPCDDCSECKAIAAGNSMDMLEFDAASNTQVEKIRDIIIDHVKYAPTSGALKLYLIDEVHMLSNSSFNALLKTLEEPPAHVKFLFATTDPEKLPATILSRCQRFDLRRIPAALITKQLAKIAQEEEVTIDDSALFAIARGADGGMRDAESTLDQLISFCGNKIEEADVLSMFGLTGQSQLLKLTQAVIAGEIEPALRELNGLAKNGKDLARLLSDLLNHFRNLLIYQVSRGDLNLLEVSEAEVASLKEQSAAVSTDALTRIMEVLSDYEGRLRDAASKKILIEVALCKAIEARTAVNLDTVLKKLNELRGAAPAAANLTSTAAQSVFNRPSLPATATPTVRQPMAKPSPSQASPRPPAASGDLSQLWAQLLEAVGRASQFTRSYLLEAHPVSLANGVFIIGFDPEFADQMSLVDNSRNHNLLQTKLTELGHPNYQIKFTQAERPVAGTAAAPAETTPAAVSPKPVAAVTAPPSVSKNSEAAVTAEKKAAPVPFNKDDFKNDPLIQKALEVFKGTIVEVRA
jgi:DNA polymerase-3 subunit gamma/tau